MSGAGPFKRQALFLGLFGITMISSGSTRADYDPFLIPQEKFRTEIKKIAIRPFRFGSDVPDADFLSRFVIHHIANKVEDAGFEVVDPPEFERLWLEYSTLLGGVYDVKTGKLDTEKEAIVFEYAMREMATQFEIDAVIRPTIFLRSTRTDRRGAFLWSAGSVLQWRGANVRYSDRETEWPQYIVSAFLGFSIRNTAGQVIYDVGCPINWSTVYMFGRFEKRALDEVYTEDSIDRATTTCVEDLAE